MILLHVSYRILPCFCLCTSDAVPFIEKVAVQFVNNSASSLDVVTHLTTNGGRDILRYYVGFGYDDAVFLSIVQLGTQICVLTFVGLLHTCDKE